MPGSSAHPVRDSLLRLVLVLAWCGASGIACLVAVGFLLVYAGSLGLRLGTAWGASFPAKAAAFIVTYLVLFGLMVGLGLAIGLAWAAFNERWPNNPVKRLVVWVKADAPL